MDGNSVTPNSDEREEKVRGDNDAQRVRPLSQPEDENTRETGVFAAKEEPDVVVTGQASKKAQGGGFLLFFSFLISLISLFLVAYLYTDSIQMKSRVNMVELRADSFNKRSEVYANETIQWRSGALQTMEGFNERMIEIEGRVADDRRERRESELNRIMLGIGELSRLSDSTARARIEEAEKILQSISPSFITHARLEEDLPDVNKEAEISTPLDAPVQNVIEEEHTGPQL